jgi:hypothetical protein
MSPYRDSQKPLRMKVYRGTVSKLADVVEPEHGDVAVLDKHPWIFDGERWRRLKAPHQKASR